MRLLRTTLPVALISNNPDEAVVRIEVALEAQFKGKAVAQVKAVVTDIEVVCDVSAGDVECARYRDKPGNSTVVAAIDLIIRYR